MVKVDSGIGSPMVNVLESTGDYSQLRHKGSHNTCFSLYSASGEAALHSHLENPWQFFTYSFTWGTDRNDEEKYVIVEDSKTSRNMCEDLLGYSHKQAKY